MKGNARLPALLLTAALTGLRASELRGLRWSNVDLKGEELHVRQRADRLKSNTVSKIDTSTWKVTKNDWGRSAVTRHRLH